MKKLLFFVAFTFGMLGANSSVFAQEEEAWDGVKRYGVNIVCDYPDGIEQVCQVFNNRTDSRLLYPLCNEIDSVEDGTEHLQYVIFTRQTTVDTILLDNVVVWTSENGLNWSVAESPDYQWDIMYFDMGGGEHFKSVQDGHGADCIWIYFRNIAADHIIRVVHADLPCIPNVVRIACTYEDGYDPIYGTYNDTVYDASCIFDADDDRPLSNSEDSVMRNKLREYYVLLDEANLNEVRIDGLKIWSREAGLNYEDAQESDAEARSIVVFTYYTVSLSADGKRLIITFRCHTSPQINILYGRGGEEPLSILEAGDAVSLSLTPNPASNHVVLSVAGGTGDMAYSLLDMSGRTVLSGVVDRQGNAEMNVSQLAKGTYLLRLVGSRQYKVEKLIVR